MLVGVMITNGGPHSPEKWAQMTAGQLIQVASTAEPAVAAEGRKLELQFIEILEAAHRNAQEGERGYLKSKGGDRLSEKLDPSEYADTAAGSILDAGKASQFRSHFEKPETAIAIKNVIGQHLVNSMHIERKWHCDKHPDDPKCREYKERGI